MRKDQDYLNLMKKFYIDDIEVNEFKKAFDVTKQKHMRSYVNQKYVSIGQKALHLLYADLYFCDDLNQIFELLDSHQRMMEISETFELNKYVYSQDKDGPVIGFIIRSTLFYAIAGIVFLMKGYTYLAKWYQNFIISYEKNVKIINEKVGII